MKIPALLLASLLTGTIACGLFTPTATQLAAPPTETAPIPSQQLATPISVGRSSLTPTPASFTCLADFSAHRASGSSSGSGVRITLSAEEWSSYLSQMGIQSLCVPVDLGAPFINADWDQARMPATGRMLSIGFENGYHGSGWSDIFLVYATYDFTTGTEFERFASSDDRDSLRDHTIAGEVEVGSRPGILRFLPSRWGYENQPQIVYKTWVFPFENDYLAVVYNLGAFDGSVNAWIQQFQRDEYPIDQAANVKIFDFLAQSLQFKETP
jgi:hypothetical protein